MTELETRLLAEGYRFPTLDQLTCILYNESFGFRGSNPEETHNIRHSRLAMALVIMNRVRQRIGRRPGWTVDRSLPVEQRATAPAVPITDPGYGLDLPGNQDAWNECWLLAGEALQRRFAPLGSFQHGCQFYSHTTSEGTSTILRDHVPVRHHIGPLPWPGHATQWLHVAFKQDRFNAAVRWDFESVNRLLPPVSR
jgi:hypothetical protein